MGKSATKQSPVIERRYQPDEGICARAVEVLLKKKAAPDGRPEDEKERSKDDSLARTHCT